MIIRYVVEHKDTILALAKQFKIAPCSILATNGGRESEFMQVGRTILIPVNTMSFLEGYSVKYVVQPADTLDSIALKFSTTVDKIKKTNHLEAIFIGQELTLSVE